MVECVASKTRKVRLRRVRRRGGGDCLRRISVRNLLSSLTGTRVWRIVKTVLMIAWLVRDVSELQVPATIGWGFYK